MEHRVNMRVNTIIKATPNKNTNGNSKTNQPTPDHNTLKRIYLVVIAVTFFCP